MSTTATHIDHGDPTQLLGTREGMAELLGNLTADEFGTLTDGLTILVSSRLPGSRYFAAEDIQRALHHAAQRIAQLHQQARAEFDHRPEHARAARMQHAYRTGGGV